MATQSFIHAEVLRLFGTLDDHIIAKIDELSPSQDELEITAAYLAGMDDVMGKERQPLTGKPAKIYDIVSRDEFPVEDDYRSA